MKTKSRRIIKKEHPTYKWWFAVAGAEPESVSLSPDWNGEELTKDQAVELGCSLIRAAGYEVDFWEVIK